MKFLSISYSYAVIFTLFSKYMNQMNSALNNIFLNYKNEQFI